MRLLNILRGGWNGLLDLFYPPLCCACGVRLRAGEEVLCADCLAGLPRTEMADHRDNSVENLFWDIKKFRRGAAFCYFLPDSDFRQLIYRLKYSGDARIGIWLGSQAAVEFTGSGFFDGIDLIVPVPLHSRRERKRGYNQAEMIARGLSRVTGIPVDTAHLYRRRNNETQTNKNAAERLENTKDLFAVRQPENWRGRHLLIVDDIVTTGATLRAAIEPVLHIRGTQVSVFALGSARYAEADQRMYYV